MLSFKQECIYEGELAIWQEPSATATALRGPEINSVHIASRINVLLSHNAKGQWRITITTSEPISYSDHPSSLLHTNHIKSITFHEMGGISYSRTFGSYYAYMSTSMATSFHNYSRHYSRHRVNDRQSLMSVNHVMGICGEFINGAFNSGKLPAQIYELKRMNPALDQALLLCMFSCPYTRMITPTDCGNPIILEEPDIYKSPQLRKAVRDNDFKGIVHAWMGTSSKSIIKAANEVSVLEAKYIDQTKSPILTTYKKYPRLLDRELFNALLKLDVPYEKAVTMMTKHSKNARNRKIKSDRYYMQPLNYFFDLVGKVRGINYLISNKSRNNFMAELSYTSDCISMLTAYENPDKILSVRGKALFPNGLKKKKNWSSFKDFHDTMSRDYTKIKALESRKKIPWPDDIKAMHGATLNGLRILLPRTTSTVVRWGQLHKQCIASYADRMVDGRCVLFGVYRGSELLYCGRLTPASEKKGMYVFSEMRGISNAEPLLSDQKVVFEIMKKFPVAFEGNQSYIYNVEEMVNGELA